MNADELNALVTQAYEAAFSFEDELQQSYQRSFDRAAKAASNKFKSTAVTAAGFVAPPVDSLTSGMTDREKQQADDIRDKAAEAVAAALIALGLAAVSVSFLAAISERGQLNFEQELLRTLRTVVAQGLAEGWTADQTALAIQQAFTNVSSTTAQMLAQTELTTLVNERATEAANKVAGTTSEPMYKRWRTVGDNRVRVAHAHAEGQTVPVAQSFQVGGSSMMYPGDPSAPMRLVARCRCRLSFTHSLTASAQEVTIVTMTENIVDEPITAGLVVTIEDTEDKMPEDDMPEDDMLMADGPAWRALLAVEGVPTEDGRMLAEGSLTWRDLPLSLMALDNTGPGGHEGAIVAGRIDSIWRDGNEVWGEGVFNSDEFGMHIAELVGNQSLRGNSIDPAVTKYEYRDAETGEVLDTNAMMDAMMEDRPVLTVFLEAIIMASTVCSTPAIGEANIMLASGIVRAVWFQEQAVETLTASAAGMAPLHPPAAWFDDPRLDAPTPLTVTKEGRVFGHAALWNSCHIGEPSGPGVCVPPPRSGMQYEIFHHGACETAEGHDVPCGQITMSTLHASRDMGWKATLEHYEHSGCAVADVQAHEDRFGIVVAGGLRPDIPAEKVRELKAGSLSGDWRQVLGRGLEFLAALVVNVGGFPIPRPEARIVASAIGEEEILALIAAGMVPTSDDVEGLSRREYMRKIGVLTS